MVCARDATLVLLGVVRDADGPGHRRRGRAVRSSGEKWQISKIVSTWRAGIGVA